MLQEQLCRDILKALHGKNDVLQHQIVHPDGHSELKEFRVENGLAEAHLLPPLMARYDIPDIDAALRWLGLREFIYTTVFAALKAYHLTPKGTTAATTGTFPEEDSRLFYRINPYSAFLARQFTPDNEDLARYIREDVLRGFDVREGTADGLQEFRTRIVEKIRDSRYYICLLTRRATLADGNYVSSVWLYQETGAAIAYGRSPLVLVEEGISPEFMGKLDGTYEYVPFTRSNHAQQFKKIAQRIVVDLEANGIPLPPLWVANPP